MYKQFFFSIIAMTSFFGDNGKTIPTVQENKSPNIIIFFPDDMGYGDLSMTGHPSIKTPNIDKLAKNGLWLTNFYSGSPACTASRYSLLTGKYPIKSGFDWVLYPKSERGIHPKEYTLAEGLKDAGYTTGIFGKWHLGSTKMEYLPLQNGFDRFVGFPYSNDMIPPKWPAIPLFDGNDTLMLNPDQNKLTKLFTEKAIDFIETNKERKFFAYLPYTMPHVPLHPGAEFRGKSVRGLYGDVIAEIDWSVGKIMETLTAENLSGNTVVFFASDNGPWIIKGDRGGSAGLFRDGKGSTWEGGMRVPGIVHWPKHISPDVKTNIVTVKDIYATALKLATGKIPENIDGSDLSPVLFGRENQFDEKSHFYYGLRNELFAVRKGPWKLHIKTHSQTGKDYFNGMLPLLFNIDQDPSEQYEVTEQHPEIVAELTHLIEVQLRKVKKTDNFFINRQ